MLSAEMETIISTPPNYVNPAMPTHGTRNAFQEWADYAASKGKNAKVPAKVEDVKPVKVKAVKPAPVPKEEKVNDKKVAALRICEANSEMNNGQLARLIAKELEITYSNAYFYSSRVWKKR